MKNEEQFSDYCYRGTHVGIRVLAPALRALVTMFPEGRIGWKDIAPYVGVDTTDLSCVQTHMRVTEALQYEGVDVDSLPRDFNSSRACQLLIEIDTIVTELAEFRKRTGIEAEFRCPCRETDEPVGLYAVARGGDPGEYLSSGHDRKEAVEFALPAAFWLRRIEIEESRGDEQRARERGE